MSAIDKTRLGQIGILVRDIEASAAAWARFLGVEPPPITQTYGYEVTHATYQGKPCQGLLRQAKFNLENIQIELISPVGDAPSVWRDCLERDGEGLHHLAFRAADMASAVAETTALGYPLLQTGSWPLSPKDGRYAYADARGEIHTILELWDC